MLQVVQVVSKLAIQIVRGDAPVAAETASVDLPPASQTRDDCVAQAVWRAVVCDQLWKLRAWSDEGHFAAQDIEELGQFIERGPSEDASDPGYAWVAFDLERTSSVWKVDG
jgi:hypothetical protein